MNTRRRTTVHDLAALRLHRDGTRVLNSDTNRSSRRAKYATHDPRGNWIAQDAGGLANVKQRRSAPRPDNNGEASESEDAEAPDGTQSSPSNSKGKGKAREDEEAEDQTKHYPRAQKRRRFNEDLTYLASVSSPALASPEDVESPDLRGEEQTPGALPIPSSDLLKCLHYFSSTYYTGMGQLHDSTREFRKQRKARRLEKASAARQGAASSSRTQYEHADPHEAPHSSGEEDFELSDDEIDAPMDNPPVAEQGSGTGTLKARQVRKKKGPRQLRPMEKDMYKIFDGSALMALGMLFQEHVAEVLRPRVQDEWEKEMWKGEREERAEAKKMRKAKLQWTKRHTVKKGSEEPADAEDARSNSGGEQGIGIDTDGGEEDEEEDADEQSTRHSILKQSSSAPVLQGSDDSDD